MTTQSSARHFFVRIDRAMGEEMIDDAPKYDELIKLYSTFGDKELQTLALDMNDLTEAAQQILKVELARRRLDLPTPATPRPEPLHDDLADSPLLAFAAMAPDECIFEYATLEDARAARKALTDAEIESVIPDRQYGSMALPRVVVAPSDAVTAQLVLSRPLVRDADGLADEAAVFVEPTCPQCGAVDPLLESVEPTNQWRCEACDHLWNDAELPAND